MARHAPYSLALPTIVFPSLSIAMCVCVSLPPLSLSLCVCAPPSLPLSHNLCPTSLYLPQYPSLHHSLSLSIASPFPLYRCWSPLPLSIAHDNFTVFELVLLVFNPLSAIHNISITCNYKTTKRRVSRSYPR